MGDQARHRPIRLVATAILTNQPSKGKSMNKTVTTLSKAMLVGTILAFGVGCAGTDTRESTGEYVDSVALTTKVKTALAQGQGAMSLIDVQVETFGDTVQLSGFVDSQADKDMAGQIAAEVNGVVNLQNAIALKSES